MHIMSFSEREYVDVSEDAIIENGSSYFGLPNTMFDPDRGGQLMNEVSGRAGLCRRTGL